MSLRRWLSQDDLFFRTTRSMRFEDIWPWAKPRCTNCPLQLQIISWRRPRCGIAVPRPRIALRRRTKRYDLPSYRFQRTGLVGLQYFMASLGCTSLILLTDNPDTRYLGWTHLTLASWHAPDSRRSSLQWLLGKFTPHGWSTPVRQGQADDVILLANGTSCRHQIYELAPKERAAPYSILKKALNVDSWGKRVWLARYVLSLFM